MPSVGSGTYSPGPGMARPPDAKGVRSPSYTRHVGPTAALPLLKSQINPEFCVRSGAPRIVHPCQQTRTDVAGGARRTRKPASRGGRSMAVDMFIKIGTL